MTFLDFFSGVGGFRLGMERAGHECVGHCEIDKYADKSYRAMHNLKEGEWYANDICRVTAGELPESDCWCGGFPCQAFSVAGKRRGFEDMRGTLIFEIFRLAAERKPKIIFLENVAGLLNHEQGRTFATILLGFWELGYDVEWEVLNSKRWVPQNRERIFIIGYLGGSRGRKIFPIGQSSGTADELSGPVANTLTTRTTADTNGTYIVEGEQYAQEIKQIGNITQRTGRENPNDGRVYDTNGIAPCLNRMDGGNRQPFIISKQGNPKNKDYASCLTGGGHSGGNHSDMDLLVCPVLTPNRPEKRQNGRRFKKPNEDMFTLTGQDRHGVMISEPSGLYTGVSKDFMREPLANCSRALKANKHDSGVVLHNRIRRLTPLECFRLQGFPDELFYKAQAVNSDSQLYKQAGNSVTVNVIFEIAQKLTLTTN